MYRSCIFCSADLGANESIEHFPVGRSLAFDAAKGRLWAVCRRCGRWNLAPIEERWEAIEAGERLFRDTRLRAQRENIGVARLPDGTRLIRVGPALAGELALFRYGDMLLRRRRRYLTYTGVGVAVGGGIAVAGIAGAGLSFTMAHLLVQGSKWLHDRILARFPLARLSAAETGDGKPIDIQRDAVLGAELRAAEGGLILRLPGIREVEEQVKPGIFAVHYKDVVLQGDTARRVLSRAMVRVNAAGARRDSLQWAVESIARAETPGEYVMRRAGEGVVLGGERHAPEQNLALEMALHEDTERRALEGELSALQEMWRQAEEIAAIADRLPDDIPASTPPRM